MTNTRTTAAELARTICNRRGPETLAEEVERAVQLIADHDAALAQAVREQLAALFENLTYVPTFADAGRKIEMETWNEAMRFAARKIREALPLPDAIEPVHPLAPRPASHIHRPGEHCRGCADLFARDADRREYPHLVICSGDRRYPAGVPGHGCCCLNTEHRENLIQLEARLAAYQDARAAVEIDGRRAMEYFDCKVTALKAQLAQQGKKQ